MDWFYVFFGLVGLLEILTGIYKWTWLWRHSRGSYAPDQIGMKNTRLTDILSGIVIMGVSLGAIFQDLFAIESWLFFVVSIALTALFAEGLFRAHEDQSLVDFIFNNDDEAKR